MDELNTIRIWDIDDLDASDLGSDHDFMGGWIWEPETFIDHDNNAFPTTLVIGSEDQLHFILEVTYEW